MKHYDYIIAGSGLSGLSLLYQLLTDDSLSKKHILLIDQKKKNQNDRTWCYWETGESDYENIVHKTWKQLSFISEEINRTFQLNHYTYKMIRAIDFYDLVIEKAKQFKNVSFAEEKIVQISEDANLALVDTEKARYSAEYVFNSTSLFRPIINNQNSLLQHFMGWQIKTKTPSFDAEVGTLMDFRLDQKNGDTFMYVLPTSSTEALVEYTLFSKKILAKEEYENALRAYINDVLHIRKYEIKHHEFGVIPMSMAKFQHASNRLSKIINIGTSGGMTKASSGYTFQFVQKYTKQMTQNMKQGQSPYIKLSQREKVFNWYDLTLLDVILSGKMTGKAIFSKMFSRLDPDTILAFLGNESTWREDLSVIRSVPTLPFLSSGLKQLIRSN